MCGGLLIYDLLCIGILSINFLNKKLYCLKQIMLVVGRTSEKIKYIFRNKSIKKKLIY